MKVLVYGSLNIDHVYQLPHFLRPGETLSSLSYQRNSGGKGLNQAIALARAGQEVWFAGGIGQDGLFLRDALTAEGVDVRLLRVTDTPTGHAIIQVDAKGGNAIILYGGANQSVTEDAIRQAIGQCSSGDLLLLQNEINRVPQIIRAAKEQGLQIALNPSPASPEMTAWPLELVDWLLLNEVEGHDLTGFTAPEDILDALHEKYPACRVVLTLGEQGAYYSDAQQRVHQPAIPAKAVDTTAAGDTFTGYFLQAILAGCTPEKALCRAAQAASIAVSRPGASASIPYATEID